MKEYLPDEFCDDLFSAGFTYQKISNVLRLKLVACYGGVYADADCFCAKPLDTWMHDAAQSGFFAFRFLDGAAWLKRTDVGLWRRLRVKTKDRAVASWFVAGAPNNAMATRFADEHFALLKIAFAVKRNYTALLARYVFKRMRRNAYLASYLSAPDLIRALRHFHYFIVHQHFARLLRTDESFAAEWEEVPKISAQDALEFSKSLGLPVNENFKSKMQGQGMPVYKLHARFTDPKQQGQTTQYEWLLSKFG